MATGGTYNAAFLGQRLFEETAAAALRLIPTLGANTPALNTIHDSQEIPYPGGEESVALALRLANILRWNNAMMVGKANTHHKVGGHIGTFASNADMAMTLLLHFFHRSTTGGRDDHLWIQGHDSPGYYALLNLFDIVTDDQIDRFRRTAGFIDPTGKIVIDAGEGLGVTSYPHAIAMPKVWHNRSVVMGCSGSQSIYTAWVDRWLHETGLRTGAHENRGWVILGDASTREPEHQADLDRATKIGARLRHLINVNLQGLDGVADADGNGDLMSVLEARYKGAGWKAIKVIFDHHWDSLLENDPRGLIAQRMAELPDGAIHSLHGKNGAFWRENFFGKSGRGRWENQEKNPELADLVSDLSDGELDQLGWGGHDPTKIYNALSEADSHEGPSVVLFRTIKGKGLGRRQAEMTIHGWKRPSEKDLPDLRDALGAPFTDGELVVSDKSQFPLWKPGKDSPDLSYLSERREALGGIVPQRVVVEPPAIQLSPEFRERTFGTWLRRDTGTSISTTVALNIWAALMTHPELGRLFPLVVADELDTYGGNNIGHNAGYFNPEGQHYTPANAADRLRAIVEGPLGKILGVGISEMGGMAAWTALATAYSRYGLPVVPVFISYAKFLFPHVGSWIWGAGDMQARGFLFSATAGKTTLGTEGEEHADGETPLIAHAMPHVRTFDPALSYEMAALIEAGINAMMGPGDRENKIWHLLMYNEHFPNLPRPAEVTDAMIRQGIYLFSTNEGEADLAGRPRVQLLGSGPIFFEAIRAQKILAEQFGVASGVWSLTSASELAREAEDASREALYEPGTSRKPLVTQLLEARGDHGPVIAATDYLRSWPGLLANWIPGGLTMLGAEGFGFPDTRPVLRRAYGIDAESQVVAALSRLARSGTASNITPSTVVDYMAHHSIDPSRRHPSRIR